jgi:hypothetical protein
MRIINFVTICALVLSASSCIIDFDGDGRCERGTGPITTKSYDVDGFTGIGLEISATVYVTQGPEYSVEAEGYRNLVDELDLDVRNGVLRIDFFGCVRNVDDFRIYITMPEIESLAVAGSGDIYSENVITSEELELDIAGSGDMDIAAETNRLEVNIAGSGDMLLEGITEVLQIRVASSGNVQAFRMDAQDVEVDIAGSGDVDVVAQNSLKVRIAGSGDVRYRGNPSLDVDIAGSGRVIDAN